MKRALFDRLNNLRNARVPVALVTDLGTGWQSLVTEDSVTGSFGFADQQLTAIRHALPRDYSGMLAADDDDDDTLDGAAKLFMVAHNPPPRLIVVGGAHVLAALIPIAELAGYSVTVIDPHRAITAHPCLSGADLVTECSEEALASLRIDRRTAVLSLTHDPNLDDPMLLAAIRSPAFYIGATGNRRTHAKRLERLRGKAGRVGGVGEAELARIHAPAGLDIDALTPAETAVAILAQITAKRRRID